MKLIIIIGSVTILLAGVVGGYLYLQSNSVSGLSQTSTIFHGNVMQRCKGVATFDVDDFPTEAKNGLDLDTYMYGAPYTPEHTTRNVTVMPSMNFKSDGVSFQSNKILHWSLSRAEGLYMWSVPETKMFPPMFVPLDPDAPKSHEEHLQQIREGMIKDNIDPKDIDKAMEMMEDTLGLSVSSRCEDIPYDASVFEVPSDITFVSEEEAVRIKMEGFFDGSVTDGFMDQ